MATPLIFQLPKQSPLQLGVTVPGARAQFYVAGTTTPQNVYTTSALDTAHSNPVIADSSGEFPVIYFDDDLRYRVQISTSASVLIYDQDNINDPSAREPFYDTTAEESAAGVTPVNKLYEPGNVLRYGTNTTPGTTDMTAAIQAAIDVAGINGGGVAYIPTGSYRTTATIRCNYSNVTVQGDGADKTIIRPNGSFKTAFEINNGSWNDSTDTYTFSGTSIGFSTIEKLSFIGTNATSATAVVFARATLGCAMKHLKIAGGFAVGARVYGSWYSKIDNCAFTSNVIGLIADYETNTFVVRDTNFTGDPTNQESIHVSFPGAGTCRVVTFSGVSFDGLTTTYGARFKGVHTLNFENVYTEVYSSHTTLNTNMIEIEGTTFGVRFDGINMIAGAGYSGTFLKLGMGSGDGANTVSISNCFQYNAGANTCNAVDTQYAVGVRFGGGNRFENGISITDVSEIESSKETQTYIPASTGTDEWNIPICVVTNGYNIPITRIRLHFIESGTTTATQFMRIQNKADSTVYVDYAMPTTITAGNTVDLTDQSGDSYNTTTNQPAINSAKTRDIVLEARTYKVGGSKDWPAFYITVEQL